MIRRPVLAAAAFLSLTAMNPLPQLEPVHAVQADGERLEVRVRSNGCTDKSSFSVDVRRDGPEAVVALHRVRRDLCRAYFRNGVPLAWSYDELGLREGTPVRLANPIAPAR
ncbi:MAG TPA: hypothetical protein VD929_07075 [Caulobacteraceae bacterium]|nr:hypothetical protein [Caulobacteraceae bacterium]